MKTRTLQEIKDEVAKEWIDSFDKSGKYNKWKNLSPANEIKLWPEVCRRAQLECGRATLEKAKEHATINGDRRIEIYISGRASILLGVDESSITSESNIVIIE